MKKFLSLVLAVSMLLSLSVTSYAANPQFSDVPSASYAYDDILALRNLGVTNGIGDGTYGINSTFKRCDFVLMLARLMKWDMSSVKFSFSDVPQAHYAATAISAAAEHGAFPSTTKAFRPNDFITREEMAVMLVRALGYTNLAAQKTSQTPFTDVNATASFSTYGAIVMAYNFGIINGMSADYPTQFVPNGVATREQAAAMMMRFYRRSNEKPENLHGFYAISSWAQRDYISSMDEISVGWARLQNATTLNMGAENGNEWSVPDGYQQVLNFNKPTMLSVYMDMSDKPMEMLKNSTSRANAVSQIADFVNASGQYSGVTIDFEGFISADYAPLFTQFLQELRSALKSQYKIYCAVPPNDYYKGYDYRAIGDICDKVILMAHDYNARTLPDYMLSKGLPETPVAPISSVYNSLAAITNSKTGVRDRSKIQLGLSFTTARWEARSGTVLHTNVKKSDYAAIQKRLADKSASYDYDEKLQSPYIIYHDDSDNTDNIVWYEDEKSIGAKCDIAQMFGIGGISVWRLGLIPSNVWPTIQNATK